MVQVLKQLFAYTVRIIFHHFFDNVRRTCKPYKSTLSKIYTQVLPSLETKET